MEKGNSLVSPEARQAILDAAKGAGADDPTKTSQGSGTAAATSDKGTQVSATEGASSAAKPAATDEAGKTTADNSATGEDASLVIQALSKYIQKDGETFVLRPMDVKKEDGTTIRSKTFYRGNTVGEVLDQIFKGIAEKDTVIDKFKGDAVRNRGRAQVIPQRTKHDDNDVTSAGRGVVAADDEPTIEPPDAEAIRADIVRKEIQRTGFDTRLLSYTDAQWDELANEKGDWRVTELRSEMKEFIKSINEKASEAINTKSALYANTILVENESQSVADYIEEFGIDIKPEEYEGILQDVLDNPKNYTKEGILKPGVILRSVVSNSKEQLTKKEASVLSKRIEDDVKAAEDKAKLAAQLKTSTGGGVGATATTSTAPRTIKSAMQAAIEEYRAGVKR
jgi:hypothetical protein